MIRLSRAFHTSKYQFQQALESSAKEQVETYLQYFRTPKDLRPLIYRKKNASELLSRDLWDPVAKQRITPREAPKIPSKQAFVELINASNNAQELIEVRKTLVELARKPKYTLPYHINAYLEKAAELNMLSDAMTFVYSQKHLRPVINQENLNVILAFIYMNPSKGFVNAINKANTAQKILHGCSNQITDLLKAAIYVNRAGSIPQELKDSITSAKELELPVFLENKSRTLEDLRYKYLQLKPITIESSKSEELSQLPNVSKINGFVSEYQNLQRELNVQDVFESVQNKSVFKAPVKEEPQDSDEASDVAEESK